MSNPSRSTGLLRLRHLREVNEATAEEMQARRERFARLADPAAAPRAVSAFNLFQTPEPLADRLARLIPLSGRVLEPSAGLGRLYRAIRCLSDCPVTLVEQSPDCCRELFEETRGDDRAELIQADFLTCDAARLGGLFDAVIMNPPFKRGTDVKHIAHALTLLKPGGQLVALCAAGSKQQAFAESRGLTWELLPAKSFGKEGTSVSVAIVTATA